MAARARVAASGCMRWLPVVARWIGCKWVRFGVAASVCAPFLWDRSGCGNHACMGQAQDKRQQRGTSGYSEYAVPSEVKSKFEGKFQERLVRSESLMTIGRTLTARDCGAKENPSACAAAVTFSGIEQD